MDDSDDKLTTINVKGVNSAQWQRAGKLAGRNGESRGEWLTRAVKLLADMEENGREFGPRDPPVKPRKELSPEQVAALLQGVAATHGNRHRAAIDLRMLAAEMAREALGLDPLPVRARFAVGAAANRLGNFWPDSRQSPQIAAEAHANGN